MVGLTGITGLTGLAAGACGRWTDPGPSATAISSTADQDEAGSIAAATRHRVDLLPDDHALGGDAPLVTIVLFSDYACPPCHRTWVVLENLLEDYGEDLRVVHRSMTAPGLTAAEEAAEAVLAAGEQGALWSLHRRFFREPPRDRGAIEAHARALDLDLRSLTEALDTGAFSGARLRHRRQALELGVAFGPVAFVNGRPVVGAYDEASWHRLIDGEIAAAKAKLAAGSPREGLYSRFLADAAPGPIALEGEAAAARDALLAALPPVEEIPLFGPEPAAGERFQVPLGGAVYAGPSDAAVVVVAYIDAACPYCRRAFTGTIPALLERYGEALRLEIRHLPLPIHPSAEGAARAALAAGRQGAFPAFYRALLTGESRTLSRSRFVAIAEELGLDRARFLADLDDPATVAAVREDRAWALGAGVQSTPSYFVNGRYSSGDRGLEALATLVDGELELAAAKLAEGIPGAEVAATIIASGRPLPDPSPPPGARQLPDATQPPTPKVIRDAHLPRSEPRSEQPK